MSLPSKKELLSRSIIENHLDYTQYEEAPEDYHLWTSLATISGAVARQVHFSQSYGDVYPNIYVCLVSGSAWCKRSTAINTGTKLLYPLMYESKNRQFLSGSITREKLIKRLGKYREPDIPLAGNCLFVHSDEFSTFLTSNAIQGGVVDFLTAAYISEDIIPFEHDTVGRETDIIQKACITILAGTQPDHITLQLDARVFRSGFIGRWFFVLKDRPKFLKMFPKPPKGYKKLYKEVLMEQLAAVSERQGEFRISPEAEMDITEWYEGIFTEERRMESESKLTGYLGRRGDHALKLAMLFSLAYQPFSDDLLITLGNAKQAMSLVDTCESHAREIFAHAGESEVLGLQDKVYELISKQRSGQMARSSVLRGIRGLTASVLDTIAYTLKDAKLIEERTQGHVRYYYMVEPEIDKKEVK